MAKHYFAHWDKERPGKVKMNDVTERLTPPAVNELVNTDFARAIQEIADGAGFLDFSPIQDGKRLPESFRGLHNGHNGTHHYIIDDFCKAAVTGKLSPTNIWEVARYNIPGLIAHESALNGGVVMSIPDLGEKPSDWDVIDPYDFDYNQK